MQIIPAILVNTFEEFTKQIKSISKHFSLVQIDVMDGELVPNKSFEDIHKLETMDNLPDLELHLMVSHPIQEIEKWEKIKAVKKIIFHIESKDDPLEIIRIARGKCWQVGLALNPKTPLTTVKPYLNLVNEILFMTVIPGKQGSTFIPEIGKKINELTNYPKYPLIAVDGGINEKNILEVKSWGVDIFCIGSALVLSKNIKQTKENLFKLIKM